MASKAYKHIGVNPIQTPDGRIIEPGTTRFEAEFPAEVESFLIKIEAIAIIPAPKPVFRKAEPIPAIKSEE